MPAARPRMQVALVLVALAAVDGRAATFSVTDPSGDGDAAPGDGICATATGGCTLAAAMTEAGATAGPHVIDIEVDPVQAPSSRIPITETVTIAAGPGLPGGAHVLWGRSLDVGPTGVLRCERLHLDGFGIPYGAGHESDYDGNGVFQVVGGRLELVDCTILDPVILARSYGGGAAIRQTGGSLLLRRCTITNAQVPDMGSGDDSGAAVRVLDADVVVEDSIIDGFMFQFAAPTAAAWYQRGGTLGIIRSSIRWEGVASDAPITNVAGAALATSDADIVLEDSEFFGTLNGIEAAGGSVVATGCRFETRDVPTAGQGSAAAVRIGAGTTAALSDCTLQASPAYALFSSGDLTLTDVTIDATTASRFQSAVELRGVTRAQRCTFRDLVADPPAISVSADADFTACAFESLGWGATGAAAVHMSRGSVRFAACSFTGNRVRSALAVDGGRATIAGSTFSGNTDNGVVVAAGGSASLDGCTLSGNAGAGLVSSAGPSVQVAHCTFADNGRAGVIATTASLSLRGCVLSRNGPAIRPTDCEGTVVSAGYVVAEAPACAWTASATDVLRAPARLSALGDHGGATLTRRPLAGSPALELVPVADCLDSQGLPLLADQRGVARPHDIDLDGDARCDAGSVEEDGTPAASIGAIPEEPSNVAQRPLVRPLLVRRVDADLLFIDWQDVGPAWYDLYRAPLLAGAAPALETFGACGLEGPWAEIPVPAGSACFLVAASSSGGASSLGRSSAGIERAPAAPPCP